MTLGVRIRAGNGFDAFPPCAPGSAFPATGREGPNEAREPGRGGVEDEQEHDAVDDEPGAGSRRTSFTTSSLRVRPKSGAWSPGQTSTVPGRSRNGATSCWWTMRRSRGVLRRSTARTSVRAGNDGASNATASAVQRSSSSISGGASASAAPIACTWRPTPVSCDGTCSASTTMRRVIGRAGVRRRYARATSRASRRSLRRRPRSRARSARAHSAAGRSAPCRGGRRCRRRAAGSGRPSRP